ncbi:phage portal protein, partial [Clostridioides difficile]|nr:phage portal protein [Clostridioides difficile]
CIVDVSETPEFIFGVHTPSALASVKEQMPIMVNKIRRKREQFTNSWQLLARMVLIMSSNSSGMKYSSYDVTIGWDEVNPRDDKELAETLEKVCSALDKALEGGFISEESTVNFLAQYIDTMSNYISDDPEIVGEREKIIKTKMLKYRLDDSQGLDDESNEIDKEIDKIKDNNDNG